jgi:transglutaminase-like putative cysteine protease
MEVPRGGNGTPAPARSVERLFEFCVLGMVACGYFAVAGSGYLDLPTILLTAAALVVRTFISSGVFRAPITPMAVNVLTLAYIGFYPIDYLFLSKEFLPATVHLVFFLAITKVVTATTDRDFSYLKVVSFLELMAACMLNGRLNFFVFLTLFLLFAVGTFTTSEIRRSAASNARVARAGLRGMQPRLELLSIMLSLGVMTMTAGLFFFLPRTARAAFQHLVSERYHLPGFSNEITLGQIGEIKTQATTVMHVRFLQPVTPPNLKWRGLALAQFDGRRWFNDLRTVYEPIKTERGGLVRLLEERQRPPFSTQRISYEVHQKDFGADTLFFAGVPEFLRIATPVIRRSASNSVRLPLGVTGEVTYIAHAYIENDNPPVVLADPLSAAQRHDYLSLPPLDPRIERLAREVTLGTRGPEARARAIEQHLRREYGYTLKLLSHEVQDPLAYFLFERRKGHCEYFASAMAVMLRTIDIPSRVVTGFQSGVFNPLSGLQLIRTSDAHSWVEAYLPGRGWTTFDPTPPDSAAAAESIWSRINLYFDAAETFWQDWVLNYDLDHQLLLATRVQDSGRSSSWTDAAALQIRVWRELATAFLKHYGAPLAAAFIMLAGVIFYGPSLKKLLSHRRRMRRVQRGLVDASDATLLYTRALRVLERKGFEKPAWVTPNEFARTLTAPDVAPMMEDLTDAYHELRFGGRREAAPRMLQLLERLEKS